MLEYLFLFASLAPSTPSIAYGVEQPRLQSIALYYSPRCPHSQRVLSFIRQKNLAIPLKDVTVDQKAKEQLKAIGGHLIVPCLIVNGTPIYNDPDIITWLADHQDQLPKNS